jgi:hypothetical protein
MDRFCIISTLMTCIVAITGCVERKLTVNSEPEGALVYLNNLEVGRTPITREFTWYGNADVQLRKEGYATLKTDKQITAPWWQWPPIDFFAEVLPLRLKDERTIAFTMTPATTQDTEPTVLIDRATQLRSQLHSSPSTRAPATQP